MKQELIQKLKELAKIEIEEEQKQLPESKKTTEQPKKTKEEVKTEETTTEQPTEAIDPLA